MEKHSTISRLILWLLSAGVLLLVVIKLYRYRKTSNSLEKPPMDFIRLEPANESKQHLPMMPSNWLIDLEKKYSNQEFKPYPNEYTEQSEKLCNDVYNNSKYWEQEKTHADFLNELTKEQKIYFTLINFESQVNNGGIYQFLFNCPELSIIALESMNAAHMDKLASDYEKVLNEYFGKFNTIQELYSKFQNANQDWNKRWNSFAEGYKELKTAIKIEAYFYNEEFIVDFQNKMIHFVKQNKSKLFMEHKH